MQRAQHLAVDQVECTLLGNARHLWLLTGIIRLRRSMVFMIMQCRDGFMGMPGGMTQRMGQCALLRHQQQQRQQPSQGDGAQHSGEQRQTRHGYCGISAAWSRQPRRSAGNKAPSSHRAAR